MLSYTKHLYVLGGHLFGEDVVQRQAGVWGMNVPIPWRFVSWLL